MSLAVTVTKKVVVQVMPKLWSITLNLVCKNGDDIVLDRDFSTDYPQGSDVNAIVLKLQGEMQRVIDWYKASQDIYNAVQLYSAVTYLNANLVG